MFNDNKFRNYVLSSFIIDFLVLMPVFYVAKFVQLNADDMVYSFVSPIDNLVNNYFHWAGAYTSMFFSPLVGGIPITLFYKIIIFCLFFSVALSLALSILSSLFNISYTLLILLNLITQVCFWYFHPAISCGFFITNWFIAYSFALGLILINNFLLSQLIFKNNYQYIKLTLLVFFSFLICGDSLTVVIPYIFTIFVWIIYCYSADIKDKRWIFFILVISFIFVLINVCAPGNFERAKYAANAAPLVERFHGGFIGYLSYAIRLFDDKRFIVFLILGILIPINIKFKSSKMFLVCYVFGFLSLSIDAILCIPTGESSGRLSNFAYYEVFFLFVVLLINLYSCVHKYKMRLVIVACLILYLCIVPSYKRYLAPWFIIPTFIEEFAAQHSLLYQYQLDIQKRVQTIRAPNFSGYVNEVNIPDIVSAGIPHLFQNCDHWLNKSMADLYKVKKICLLKKDISSDPITYLNNNEYFWILK